jgi:hypothetical protein
VKFASSHFRQRWWCFTAQVVGIVFMAIYAEANGGTDHALPIMRNVAQLFWRDVALCVVYALTSAAGSRDDAQLHEQRLIAAFLVGGSMMISRNGQPGTNKGHWWVAILASLPAWSCCAGGQDQASAGPGGACCPAWGRLRYAGDGDFTPGEPETRTVFYWWHAGGDAIGIVLTQWTTGALGQP